MKIKGAAVSLRGRGASLMQLGVSDLDLVIYPLHQKAQDFSCLSQLQALYRWSRSMIPWMGEWLLIEDSPDTFQRHAGYYNRYLLKRAKPIGSPDVQITSSYTSHPLKEGEAFRLALHFYVAAWSRYYRKSKDHPQLKLHTLTRGLTKSLEALGVKDIDTQPLELLLRTSLKHMNAAARILPDSISSMKGLEIDWHFDKADIEKITLLSDTYYNNLVGSTDWKDLQRTAVPFYYLMEGHKLEQQGSRLASIIQLAPPTLGGAIILTPEIFRKASLGYELNCPRRLIQRCQLVYGSDLPTHLGRNLRLAAIEQLQANLYASKSFLLLKDLSFSHQLEIRRIHAALYLYSNRITKDLDDLIDTAKERIPLSCNYLKRYSCLTMNRGDSEYLRERLNTHEELKDFTLEILGAVDDLKTSPGNS